jgi:sialidase-1
LDDEVLFFNTTYHVLGGGQPAIASGFVRRSRDEGKTFSEPATVYARQQMVWASGTVKRLSTGRIILPLDCFGGVWPNADHAFVSATYSDDRGHTWQRSKSDLDLPLRGAMEAHIEELKDGRLMMVMRTQLGAVFHSHSRDGGESWSKPQVTPFRAPESCPELARVPTTGDLALVWNNSEYDPKFGSHYGKRSPLTIAVSRDDGTTWSRHRDIETDPRWAFSNPGLFFFGKGRAILLYWACPYTDQWLMNVDLIDLKAAIFDVKWLYE